MSTRIVLPGPDGTCVEHTMNDPADLPSAAPPITSRTVYAAVHVVADPLTASTATSSTIDWDATLEQRRRTWRLGLGVADAMDTAQRGMGLSWADVQQLTRLTLEAARSENGSCVIGIATDQLGSPPGRAQSGSGGGLDRITEAYLEQLELVQGLGGTPVMMASRHLAAAARGPEDYFKVYDAVLTSATSPVVLHWLGTAFDARLTGYWGSTDLDVAQTVVGDLLDRHAGSIDGIKISLLDAARERAVRAAAPASVKIYTGDDFNYPELIAPDADGSFSHALLGAFAAVPGHARAAFTHLDAGDPDGFRTVLDRTVPLSRLVFTAPTQYYKTGITWLAWLQGHQQHFRMVAGLESGRSLAHLVAVFVEADRIGLFADPGLAASRMRAYLCVHGLPGHRVTA